MPIFILTLQLDGQITYGGFHTEDCFLRHKHIGDMVGWEKAKSDGGQYVSLMACVRLRALQVLAM